MDSSNAYTPKGRFSASLPLWSFISFAYKLGPNLEERQAAVAQFPKGLSAEEYFEIDARTEAAPTKDQLRLMLQSLLADRFKLAVHFASREVPVFALTLSKPGKLGPKLRPHSEGPPCLDLVSTPLSDAPPTPPGAGELFPRNCEFPQVVLKTASVRLAGERDATMPELADAIYRFGVGAGQVDRPVIDKTGLTGTFDFTLEYSAQPLRAAAPTATATDSQGTPFLDAVREQLGLRLAPSRSSIPTLVIDHVERASQN